MTVNSRILTCSYNRRRLQIVPQHHDEPTMQATKPQMTPLKSRTENPSKLLVVSENVSPWPTVGENMRTSSSESEPDASESSVFRRRTSSLCDHDQEESDMFALKRANPVYDSDDEDYMESPTKRQRMKESSILHWDEQLSDGDAGSLPLSFFRDH